MDIPDNQAEASYDWAKDANPLFTFLGIYLATFQLIEARLDQILLLAGGHKARLETQARLARMSNEQKVVAFSFAALNEPRFERVIALAHWQGLVNTTIDQLTTERRRRNNIMHAAYLFEGVEHGFPAIRSIRRKGAGVQFEHEEMTRERMDNILEEIAELVIKVGRIYAQLAQLAEY